MHQPDHRELFFFDAVVVYRDGFSHRGLHFLCLAHTEDTFRVIFGPAPFEQDGTVDIIRIVFGKIIGQAVKAGGEFHIVQHDRGIHLIAGHHTGNPRHLPNCLYVIIGQAQCGENLDIHHIGVIVVAVYRVPHVGGAGEKPAKESGSQRHNSQNGKKPAPGMEYCPQGVFSGGRKAVSLFRHYHSILSAGRGASLSVISCTRPLLI